MAGTLTEKQVKLLAVFKDAIEREKGAQKLYTDALRLCEEPELRGVIETFIAQEKQHEEILLRLYRDLRTTGQFKDDE